ncbi:glutamate racemase [Sporocytophaga myxococcoides]|uniref:Glutamate racemase n=1 Tax=Sporocytophaga myxococcoides TaxID=153721 RepID=A0A098LGB3_9BACT|nr:glutamate racemase [Sporocytophaga myxococcoides]GAL85477.1 glutamate racemase [Sporocytophaga myxococcoides]
MEKGPIGVFDSGFGGLTVLREFEKILPEYDYLYLGDNARAPYGTRSFDTVYQYTLECVKYLFDKGCHLVILACNTASAKALRSIQKQDLNAIDSEKRVLGVIRPTTEIIGSVSQTRHVGILGTKGTIESNSYPIEIHKFYPEIQVFQEACPMWVPLVENNEYDGPGADYFIEKHIINILSKSSEIDTLVLGCTHYPLLAEKIQNYLPSEVKLVSQGEIVAKSLKDYLFKHPEMQAKCSKGGTCTFYTTDSTSSFDAAASVFMDKKIESLHITL